MAIALVPAGGAGDMLTTLVSPPRNGVKVPRLAAKVASSALS